MRSGGTTRERKDQGMRKEGKIIRKKMFNKHIAGQEFIMERNNLFRFVIFKKFYKLPDKDFKHFTNHVKERGKEYGFLDCR